MIDANMIKDLTLFYDMDASELDEVAKACDYRIFQPGEVIMKEGDPGGIMFLIRAGEIKITRKVHHREDMVLTILRENDFFGEMSLMDGRARSATATAVTHAELIILDKESFDVLAKNSPACGYKVVKRIAIMIGSLLREMNEKFVGMMEYMWR